MKGWLHFGQVTFDPGGSAGLLIEPPQCGQAIFGGGLGGAMESASFYVSSRWGPNRRTAKSRMGRANWQMRSGQKSISERKFFPDYVLVEMEMTDDTWHLVKNTAKVTGFVGGTAMKPTPISEKEVQAILHQIQEGVEKPKPKVLFEVGEMVRVKDGPFTDFQGTVEDVNYEKSRLRVAVTIFGRSTPVELEFGQVEKA